MISLLHIKVFVTTTSRGFDVTRVYGWAADLAGCWHYRMKFPMDAVKEGPNADSFVFGSDTSITKEWMESADTIVGQRVCKDAPSGLWQKWAQEGQKKLVFEMDDDLWHVDPENKKAYDCFKKPDIQSNLIKNIQVSHIVTVSTEPLAEVVRKKTGHADIRVIPNAVPAWLVDHEADETHTTGYMGSPTHHRDIKPVTRHFKRFFDNNPEATFHSIGFDYGTYMMLPGSQSAHTPWIKDVPDALKALDYSFGVAPLTASKFARSKSDIKAIELAALGRPTVASNTAPYQTIQDGVTGLLVKYEHEWLKKLQAIYEDDDLRREMGKNAKEYVARERTTEHVRKLWEDVYRP